MLRSRRILDSYSSGAANITLSEPIDNSDANINNYGHHPQQFQQKEITAMGYLVIAAFLLVFSLILLLLLARYLQRHRRATHNSTDPHGQPYHPTRRATKIRIQRRYETVEHWIISKRAVPHDGFCDVVRSNFGHHNQPKDDKHHHEQARGSTGKGSRKKTRTAITEGSDGGDPVPFSRTLTSVEVSRGSVLLSADAGGVEASESSSSFDDLERPPCPQQDEESMECPSAPIDNKNESSALVNESIVPRSSSASSSTPSCEVMTDVDDDSHSNNGAIATAIRHRQGDNVSNSSVRECPICMGEIQAGQIVSWSANELCSHVYHHECIKEWLLRHIECCLCKNIYLPVDEKKGRAKTDALKELSQRYAAACATSYYCVESGLVRIPRSVRCTRSELQRLERRIFDGAIPPARLVTLRGNRQELSSPVGGGGWGDEDPGDEPLDIINSEASSSGSSSDNNVLNTTMDTTITTDSTVLVEDPTEDVVSNNASSNDESFYCNDHPRQRQQPDDAAESSSHAKLATASSSQLNSTFPCSSSTLNLCSYGASGAVGSPRRTVASSTVQQERDSEVGSTEDSQAATSMPKCPTISNWESVIVPRRSNSSGTASQSIMRPESDRSSGVGSDDLVTASEYLELNRASVVGDNRCRIIDSFDETDGVEVAATTHQTLMDAEDINLLLSATSSNRSDDSSVEYDP